MKITVLTLFPEMFAPLYGSIIGRAVNAGKLDIEIVNIRDYAENKHSKCDDYPFGGGAGMVMMPQPIGSAITAIDPEHRARRIYLSPKGATFTQDKAFGLLGYEHLILLCGHYEGVDQRVIDLFIDEEISIGDYVLTGGELAACIIADSVVRIIPGAIGDEASALTDCFQDDMLAPPVYTRPAEFNGWRVPDVLLSGNFAEIEKWQDEQSWERTQRLRPDLLADKTER